MSRGKARHQKSRQLELALEAGGEAPEGQRSGEAGRAAHGTERSGSPPADGPGGGAGERPRGAQTRAAQQGQSGHRWDGGGGAGALSA